METYRFQLPNGNIVEIDGDIRIDAKGNHYVWSCQNYYEEDASGKPLYNSWGPMAPSKAASWIRGAKPLP